MATTKSRLRRELRARRAQTLPDLLAGWSAAVCARVAALDTWRAAATVHLFLGALPGEVRTDTLLLRAFAESKTVICPRSCAGGRLGHRRVTSLSDLVPARFGLLEPDPAATDAVDPSDADLILVPGLGFDPSGARIGMGGGYYDRFLSQTDAVQVGLAFEWQVLTGIPTQAHDQGVDGIVTELRVIEVTRPEERAR